MRSKILRKREQNFIRSNAEVTPKKRPWGKYIYLGTLALVAASGIKWGIEHLLYIQASGFLEGRVSIVSAQATGRITRLWCAINDTVKIGQPLVSLDAGDSTDVTSSVLPAKVEYYTNERRIIDTRRRISVLSERISKDRQIIKAMRNQERRAEQLLGVGTIRRSEYVALKQNLLAKEHELAELQIDYQAAVNTLNSYLEQRRVLYGIESGAGGATFLETRLNAPLQGLVADIYRQKGEVVKVGEPVLQIVDKTSCYIKAYFAGSNEHEFQAGDKATIEFENGDSEEGIVRRIYPVTNLQPPEMKHKFGKMRRFIIAEIVPASGKTWDRIFGTQVRLFIARRWLGLAKYYKR